MKRTGRGATNALLVLAMLLSGCGGGSSGGGGSGGTSPTPSPTPTPNASCTLRARQDWAATQLREWYLFPDTLPAALDPAPYASVTDYIDALTATARAQGKDRYFTYVTSIAEEDAYFSTGGTIGFGVRLKVDAGAGRVFISEAFEGTPALAAGLDRGAEILAIGPDAGSLRAVADIVAAQGDTGVVEALGPGAAGVTRALRVRDPDGTERTLSLAKASYTLATVSSRYGAQVIDDGGRKIGYLNLRSFLSSANTPLRQAFAGLRAQGIDELIVDLRYNGGGLLSVAQLMGNLLGGNRFQSDVFTRLVYRPEKASQNGNAFFQPQPESVSPRKIAFIGLQGTASASEVLINGMVPYLHAQVALVGSNTAGKPVGQIAIDRAVCDDRLRIVAFSTANAAGRSDYYTGLAPAMEATCEAGDDVRYPLGDPREAMVRTALDFLGGRGCRPIGSASAAVRAQSAGGAVLLVPAHPTPAQREVPGAF